MFELSQLYADKYEKQNSESIVSRYTRTHREFDPFHFTVQNTHYD